jgi:hypothetical protein
VGVKEGHWSRGVKSMPLTLGSGRDVVTLEVPPLHHLTILTDGLPGEAKVGLRAQGGDANIWISPKTPEDGRVRFDRLPAGRYMVWAQGEGERQEMVVALCGPTSVRFAPQAMNALLVDIHDLDGHLSRAGLKDGDLIVKIDGEEIVNRDQGRGLLTVGRSKESVKLTVLRGRSSLEIPIDLRRTRGEQAGGRLLASPR